MTDQEIIELLERRSEDALSAVQERLDGYCCHIARNILGDEGSAQECVNDAYLKLWQSVPPESPRDLTAYLGRITRNLALSRWRRDRAEKRGGGQAELALSELGECVPTVVSLEDGAGEGEIARCINAWLLGEPPEKRRVFVGRYFYLRPVKELARAYGVSETKVKSMLFRMRKDLKKQLSKEGIEL